MPALLMFGRVELQRSSVAQEILKPRSTFSKKYSQVPFRCSTRIITKPAVFLPTTPYPRLYDSLNLHSHITPSLIHNPLSDPLGFIMKPEVSDRSGPWYP